MCHEIDVFLACSPYESVHANLVESVAGRFNLTVHGANNRTERPGTTFWAAEPEISGAPARFGDLFPGTFLCRGLVTGFSLLGLADEEGEGLREESGAG